MSTRPTYEELRDLDLAHLWHPFTQQKTWIADGDPLIVERGEGCELIDVRGKRYLDGVSSLWCNVHGHGVPEIVSALKSQSERLCHSTLLGLSHVPILELTARLINILPRGLSRVFYSDSGSAAVEAGLRMSLEWWQKQGTDAARRKTKIVSLEGSYHGDTLGSVGVGFDEAFHWPLRSSIVQAMRVPSPHLLRLVEGISCDAAMEASLQKLERMFRQDAGTIAALIIEPLVQGAAGIWTHTPFYLGQIAELCRRHDVRFIVDEVATGFGKTGKMFAVEFANISPDIMIMGKGLTGGYLPMSAVAASQEVFEGFLGNPEEGKTFFFGQTFSGNPLCAAAACASLDLFESKGVLKQTRENIAYLGELLNQHLKSLSCVAEVRRVGLMTGIEFTRRPREYDPFPIADQIGAKIVRAARNRGVIIRPLGNVMVLMPALAMTKPELERLVAVTTESIVEVLGS